MFEDYIRDAHRFFEQARGAVNDNEEIARSYYRASIFCAASAVESFVNFIADTFDKGQSMSQHELAYLSDKAFYFDPKKGLLIEKTEFHRLEDKLKFLLTKFSPLFDFNNAAWSQLIAFKRLRDSLIHPKQLEDQTSVAIYEKQLRLGIQGSIQIMNELSKAIFSKPLRQQILDMRPE